MLAVTVEVNQQKPHLCAAAAAASSTHHQLGPGDGRFFFDSCLIGRFCCAGDGGGGEGEHQRGPHSDQPSTFFFFFFCFATSFQVVSGSCIRLVHLDSFSGWAVPRHTSGRAAGPTCAGLFLLFLVAILQTNLIWVLNPILQMAGQIISFGKLLEKDYLEFFFTAPLV